MRNTEIFGYKPSVYTAGGHPQLDLFSGRLGVPGVWSKTTGAGFGAIYSNKANVTKVLPISLLLQTMLLRMATPATQVLVVL